MRYPEKYFCGPGLSRYPSNLLERGLKLFNDKIAIKAPITGETGIDGVLLDFNCGLRLQIPDGNWHARIGVDDVTFFDEDVECVTLISMEKFYIEWEIALWLDGEPIFYHQFDPRGARVHFVFAQPPIGDNIAMLPYAEEFRRAFDCEVTCKVPDAFTAIVENYFPTLKLSKALPDDAYACYYLAGWMNLPIAAPADMRSMTMESFCRAILNTPRIRQPSKVIYRPTEPRKIMEPYVCIGVQASYNPKCWLSTGGWDCVVDHLKAMGYRVLCIDRDRRCSNYGMTVEMPAGAEDFSGSYDLIDRVNQLAYADFFIGLSSGLSWLAWAVDVPVVMISGFSEPWYEFDTPYRIYNPLVCHGCFNDMRVDFSRVGGCVSYKDAARKYECTKTISARMVIDAIDRLIADRKLLGGSA
ncbi:MAG: autotransporter strand-loop-strand O-heptosyltransferase [Selenomonadaceae bacterium]|nr:autotransporter strand-loop-strand O-heptosyltransferase [Selenomonadaceae bacterium]